MSIQDPDSVGKVRNIFQFCAVFRDLASDCTKLRLSHVEFCYNDEQAVPADYGDLPDDYGITQLGDSGARHIPLSENDVWLGILRDLELNGIPHDSAMGDDMDDTENDEDGVVRGASWSGGSGTVSVTVTGPSCLMGWMDWATVDESNDWVMSSSNVISHLRDYLDWLWAVKRKITSGDLAQLQLS